MAFYKKFEVERNKTQRETFTNWVKAVLDEEVCSRVSSSPPPN